MPVLDTVALQRQSPFSQALDRMKEKLGKTEDPFAAKVLNSWCRDFGGGELHTYIMDGESTIIFDPTPDTCPAIQPHVSRRDPRAAGAFHDTTLVEREWPRISQTQLFVVSCGAADLLSRARRRSWRSVRAIRRRRRRRTRADSVEIDRSPAASGYVGLPA